jgi:hypothetical protein
MKRYLSQENLESVSRVVARSNFKDLTPDTLLTAFQEEGIQSLDDLAKQLTKALQDPKGLPEKLNYETILSRPTPRELVETIVHQVPQIPFRVDGVLYNPEDIVRFNGKELCFIGNNRSRDPELLVLEDKSVWAPFVRMTMLTRQVSADPVVMSPEGGRTRVGPSTFGGGGFPTSPPGKGTVIIPPGGGPTKGSIGGPPETGPALVLYEHARFQGDSLSLDSGESYRDLTHVGWWVFASDWNDKISSNSDTTSLCLAFEHVGFQGSTLWLGPHLFNWDLTALGWNDRISSVINSG